ncbi:MAG TPA: hypothetical protein VMG30_19965 [Acidobacteriota bacterium]|nr:hypothetical protein [Acidobacteriota bacterium]
MLKKCKVTEHADALVLNRGWFRTFDHEYVTSYDRETIKLPYTFRL